MILCFCGYVRSFPSILYNFEEKTIFEIFKIYIKINEKLKKILFILTLLSSLYNKRVLHLNFLSHPCLLDSIILNLFISYSNNNYIDLFAKH